MRQKKFDWCTLNFFGSNIANKAILWAQNYIFKCILIQITELIENY